MAKAETERLIYAASEESNGAFECMSILPMHVIGPLMCKNHDQPFSWQNCIVRMMNGRDSPMGNKGRLLWNMVDVRDCARSHRLCLEVPTVGNGSRFILSATDRSYEMYTWQLAAALSQQYPQLPSVGGEPMAADGTPTKPTTDNCRAYCMLARQLLGLETYSIDETIRATGDSYIALGLVQSAEERVAIAAEKAAEKAAAAKKSRL
jgi:nucleoside-diphosphate-sugar epimerase